MTVTGNDIVRDALRELGILDPIETGEGEDIADGIRVASDLVDAWRIQKLTIGGVTRNTYSLSTSTASYTIGSGGAFSQDYPQSILRWSVITDDDAADVLELPMGRPYTWQQWQQIRQKTLTGSHPTVMYYDEAYSAGLGNCSFYPVPDNGDVDVVLYCAVPVLTTIVGTTSYDLRPGCSQALKLQLALRLAPRHGVTVSQELKDQASEAFASFKRQNYIPVESSIREEFVIGQGVGRRTYNIYTGGT